MVKTRGMGVAAPQTSFWVVAMLLISIGVEMLLNAGGDFNREVLGVIVVVIGVVVILLKYFLKLPDISTSEAEAAIANFEHMYDTFIQAMVKTYGDIVKARDEIVAHRQVIEALAAFLPATYQARLKELLDALEGKYRQAYLAAP